MGGDADLDFNPLDPAFYEDPYPTLRRLREHGQVLENQGSYLVVGHDPARELLRRKDGSTRWLEFQQMRNGPGVESEPYCRGLADGMLMVSGEQHRRIRGSFIRNFSNRAVETLREGARETAHRLIDSFADAGEVELMERFAAPVPLWTISQLLRVPHEDEPKIMEWLEGFLLAVQLLPLTPEQLDAANRAITSLNDYFTELVAERRRNPGGEEDLLTQLIAEADAGAVTENEMVTSAWMLFVGGNDTTASTIGNGVVALAEHPDQAERLAADPSGWPNAVEEILRFVGPVNGTHRFLESEIELDDQRIPADTPIMVYLSAANRDEGWCPHAESFDTTRDVPVDHVAFGTGPHVCPGQHMARMMVREALAALFSRLQGIRVVDVSYASDVLNFRGPANLRIAWDRQR